MMDIRLETFPARTVIYAKEIGPYGEKAKTAWNRLWGWYFELKTPPAIKSCIGYGLDSARIIPADMLRYYACLELDLDRDALEAITVSDDMGSLTMEGGRYAIYQMKGDYQGMPDYFAKLHDKWLPNSGHIPDYSRPFLEIYLNNPNEVGLDNALTDLCMPIREDRAA